MNLQELKLKKPGELITEAEKLGFTKIVLSKHNKIAVKNNKIELILFSKIEDIVSELLD